MRQHDRELLAPKTTRVDQRNEADVDRKDGPYPPHNPLEAFVSWGVEKIQLFQRSQAILFALHCGR
jgi:hypothetical protein